MPCYSSPHLHSGYLQAWAARSVSRLVQWSSFLLVLFMEATPIRVIQLIPPSEHRSPTCYLGRSDIGSGRSGLMVPGMSLPLSYTGGDELCLWCGSCVFGVVLGAPGSVVLSHQIGQWALR